MLTRTGNQTAELHRMARYPGTPVYTLARLATDPDSSIRRTVAGNPSLSVGLVTALVRDPDPEVRLVAGRNPNAPGHVRVLIQAGT